MRQRMVQPKQVYDLHLVVKDLVLIFISRTCIIMACYTLATAATSFYAQKKIVTF